MEFIHINLENQRETDFTTSTISTEIQEFYSFCSPNETFDEIPNTELKFINQNGQIIWEKLNEFLQFNKLSQDELEEELKSTEQCRNKIESMNHILQEIFLFFFWKSKEEIDDLIEDYGSWTNRVEDLKLAQQKKGSADTKFAFDTMVYTSILEFSLGSVYFTKTGKSPPHLLKDLLKSSEINETFNEIMPFLRYILGTPSSVNLRNIVWHGFPRAYEIDEAFPALVLLIILNIGMVLKQTSLDLTIRPYTLEAVEKMSLINITSDWMESKPVTFLKVICSSRTLLDFHKMFWVRAIHSFLDKNYGQSLLILLPQLEMMLRLLYGAANDIDISAAFDRYYVIMDTIFEDKTPDDKPNLLKKIMDDSTLSLMYDLFISPKGPRIRDRLSHGEIPLNAITEEVATKVFLFTFHIISQFDSIIELPTLITGYQCYFHPISEFYRKVESLNTNLDGLRDFNLPEELLPGSLLGAGRESNVPPAIGKYKEIICGDDNCVKYLRGETFNREILTLLIQILDNSQEAVDNFHTAMKTRHQEYVEHTLSTARRKTFENMVKHFDEICLGLVILLCIGKKANFERTFVDKKTDEQRAGMIKDFKIVLKWTENLKTFLNPQKNDWESACELTILLFHFFEKSSK